MCQLTFLSIYICLLLYFFTFFYAILHAILFSVLHPDLMNDDSTYGTYKKNDNQDGKYVRAS